MPFGIGIYIKNSNKAVEAYKSAFGLELGYHVMNDDGETFFHSELEKNGENMCSVVESKSGEDCVRFGYTFETREELERAFEILKEGGKVNMEICELPWSPCAAEVKDRFGICWYLTLPEHRPPEDFKPSDCKQ